MRLAAFQMVARAGDVAANLAMIETAAAEAKGRGAEVLVAPELATTGYGAGDAIRDLAEPADGPQVARLAAIAARHGLSLVAGFPERAGTAIYNSAALVRPSGRHEIYRKRHLYGDYERDLFTPGDSAPRVVDLGALKAGILICYDVEFPESVRHLALAGADLVLVPTAQPQASFASFIAEKIVPVRAFENGLAIVYADHAGADERFAYAGLSCIAMPDGIDAARAGPAAAEVIVANFLPESYAACRRENPYLADVRTDLLSSEEQGREAPVRSRAPATTRASDRGAA